MALIGLGFGFAIAFWGYKLLWIILPIWGFFVGFVLGAQTIQFLFDDGAFLATVTGWVVGFIVGGLFALLSYLFYFAAVAILAGAFGYGLTVAILDWIGMDTDWLIWLIAIVAGVALAFVVLKFNIQKYAVIFLTSFAGIGITVYVFLAAFYGVPAVNLIRSPVALAIDQSALWFLYYVILVAGGIYFQLQTNKGYEYEEYNRWVEESGA
jgi:hypothetical protein